MEIKIGFLVYNGINIIYNIEIPTGTFTSHGPRQLLCRIYFYVHNISTRLYSRTRISIQCILTTNPFTTFIL